MCCELCKAPQHHRAVHMVSTRARAVDTLYTLVLTTRELAGVRARVPRRRWRAGEEGGGRPRALLRRVAACVRMPQCKRAKT
eukprot:5963098-Pleurochrysis_carterae.AAC.3